MPHCTPGGVQLLKQIVFKSLNIGWITFFPEIFIINYLYALSGVITIN